MASEPGCRSHPLTLGEGMNELMNKGIDLRVNGCALIHFLRLY